MPVTAMADRRASMPDYAPLKVRSRRRKALPPDAPELTDARRHYAQCRALGHSWHHVGRTSEDGAAFGSYGFVSACECGTQRTKWIVGSGRTAKARYTYPRDYAARGEDSLSAAQWRRVLIVSLGYE